MNRILLVDVDSTIPNIPLMKLSTHYKKTGCQIDLQTLKISYYPNRKKFKVVNAESYDKVFVSSIFFGNLDYVSITGCENVEYGGTGYSIKKPLPPDIDSEKCDYSIYPKNETSYGFITRGCIRNCKFCVVPQKEGKIRQVNNIEDIIQHKKVKFLDNNILAHPSHETILKELVDKKIKCQFNQGLDIRLITHKNAGLLSKLNYIGEYIFAFDDLAHEKKVEDGLEIFKKYVDREWKEKFFVYCHPDMSISDDILYRIYWCRDRKVLPYLMRDVSCWNSEHKDLYTDLAAWCNQPGIFKNMSFYEFLLKRHPRNKKRIEKNMDLYTCDQRLETAAY